MYEFMLRRPKAVDVFGNEMYIKSLSLSDIGRISSQSGGDHYENLAKSIVTALCDADGKRVLKDSDWKMVYNEWDGKMVSELGTIVLHNSIASFESDPL